MKNLRFTFSVISFVAIVLFTVNSTASSGVDHGLLEEFLDGAVTDGEVDYSSLKKRTALLEKYLDSLAAIDSNGLDSQEQFAFFINAYNGWTIKLILDNYPGVGSIKELGSLFRSPWKKKICRVDGKLVSLDHIEHEILRPRFKDPRVHFAVNCASKGCPPLKSTPYTGSELDQQLNEVTISFINDRKHNHLEKNTLHVSSIFKWFSKDFNNDILSFFLRYGDNELKAQLEERKSRISIDYLDYDWSLNGK